MANYKTEFQYKQTGKFPVTRPDFDEDGIGDPARYVKIGSNVVQVRDLNLAIALQSVGCLLYLDKPFVYRKSKEGLEVWVFNFLPFSGDGIFKTEELVKAYSEDMKWIQQNPNHPFTYVMCALKNMVTFKELTAKQKPMVSFRAGKGKAVLHVQEGSKKYDRCIGKGMTQV